jgi:hypothetical protein
VEFGGKKLQPVFRGLIMLRRKHRTWICLVVTSRLALDHVANPRRCLLITRTTCSQMSFSLKRSEQNDLEADSIPSGIIQSSSAMHAARVPRRYGKSVALPRLGQVPKSDSIALYVVPCPGSLIQNAQTTYPGSGISRIQTPKLALGQFTAFLGIVAPDVSALHLHLSHGISNAVQLSNHICDPLLDSGKILVTGLSSSRRRSQVQGRCRRKLSLVLLCLFLLVFVVIAVVLFIFVLFRSLFFICLQIACRRQGGYIFGICLTPCPCQLDLSSS